MDKHVAPTTAKDVPDTNVHPSHYLIQVGHSNSKTTRTRITQRILQSTTTGQITIQKKQQPEVPQMQAIQKKNLTIK